MLTEIDTILFPIDCEVVEIPLHNQWVYLIQKNGTSSLREEAKNKSYRIIKNQEVSSCEVVDIYIREPLSRYLSGLNTFVNYIKTYDNPDLDINTCVWMSVNFGFLNRHYLPQFHWIVNLSRFINADTKLRFHTISELKNITSLNRGPNWLPPINNIKDIAMTYPGLDLWLFVDQMLLDLAGKELTWTELKEHYRSHSSECFKIITNNSMDILKNLL